MTSKNESTPQTRSSARLYYHSCILLLPTLHSSTVEEVKIKPQKMDLQKTMIGNPRCSGDPRTQAVQGELSPKKYQLLPNWFFEAILSTQGQLAERNPTRHLRGITKSVANAKEILFTMRGISAL